MNLKNADLTSPAQKAIAAGVGVGVLAILYYALPPLVVILKNLWLAVGLGVPLLFLAYNYDLAWAALKQLSWETTKKLVSTNPLWYMWQGYKYFVSENEALNQSIIDVGTIMQGQKKNLTKIAADAKRATDDVEFLQKKGGQEAKLKVLYNRVTLLNNQFNNLEPRVKGLEDQHQLLTEWHIDRVADAEILKETLIFKEDEYSSMKEMAKASRSASRFMKESKEMEMYRESIKQIEKSIDTYASTIENFKREVLPKLQQADLQREMNEEEGKRLIEEYKQKRLNL